MAFTTSLEGQTTGTVSYIATSELGYHSLIATVYVVQGIVNGNLTHLPSPLFLFSLFVLFGVVCSYSSDSAVIKPPMAKIADVFGRLEAFCISILLYVLGYIQQATAQNIQTFASAQIFYSAGFTGLQILQQIFIADTSDLVNRALFSALPDLPFLVTTWVGPLIGDDILAVTTWRWAYGMWAIILPVTFVPLALTLFTNGRKAKKLGLVPPPRKHFQNGVLASAKKLVLDLDLGGIILLSAAFALILLPLTLAATASGGWNNGGIIAMIVIGFVVLFVFPAWEASSRLAPHPLIPLNLLRSRTFCAGCAVGFFYFSKRSLPVVSFPSFLFFLSTCFFFSGGEKRLP